MKAINSDEKMKVISSDEIRKWEKIDPEIDLLPGYEIFRHPSGELNYLLFEKEVLPLYPEEKPINILDITLIHSYNQKK